MNHTKNHEWPYVSPPLVSGSHRVIHEANSVNNHKRAMLQDLTTEHARGHLRHKHSVTVN